MKFATIVMVAVAVVGVALHALDWADIAKASLAAAIMAALLASAFVARAGGFWNLVDALALWMHRHAVEGVLHQERCARELHEEWNRSVRPSWAEMEVETR